MDIISILDENGNGSPNINVQKSIDVSLGACYAFYNEKISLNDWNKARPSYYSYRFK